MISALLRSVSTGPTWKMWRYVHFKISWQSKPNKLRYLLSCLLIYFLGSLQSYFKRYSLRYSQHNLPSNLIGSVPPPINWWILIKRWAIPGLFFFIFVFFIVKLVDKIMPMPGFEPRISGVGSNRSPDWTTTTAQRMLIKIFFQQLRQSSITSCKNERLDKIKTTFRLIFVKMVDFMTPRLNVTDRNLTSINDIFDDDDDKKRRTDGKFTTQLQNLHWGNPSI